MTPEGLVAELWSAYTELCPRATEIHDLLGERGDVIVNDHVAFRTFDTMGASAIARYYLDNGWREAGRYVFEQKHLDAVHLEPDQPGRPKIFISELRTRALGTAAQAIIGALVDQVPTDVGDRPDYCNAGRHWSVTRADYLELAAESEYAAWLAAFGLRANHFTVLVNDLTTVTTLQQLNDLLRDHDFTLNDAGGVVKGSAASLLEQSSTMADPVPVAFADGSFEVPGCYYEFARRYDLPSGERFEGFLPDSADRIFESTDRRTQ